MIKKELSEKNLKIAIIGFGRFGRLFAETLLPYGEIFIISSKKIDDVRFKQIDYEGLKEIDWAIPSVPISTLRDTLEKIKPYLKEGALVMDVCSVKELPCQWMQETLPENVEVIGTHPMFGPDSAKMGLENLQIVICPLRQSHKTLEMVKGIFSDLKLKIIETTPEEHDRQAAKSLSLVHFIGRGLEGVCFQNQDITTLGFERLLRVCETVSNDTWQLFYDMQKYNPYAQEVREDFIKALEEINKKIKDE